jgi:hypothetical protein
MIPVLIGYFRKRRTQVIDWLTDTPARGLYSVSECLAPGPPDWVDHWIHNEWGYFNSIVDALSVIPSDSLGDFEILAFALFSVPYDGGHPQDLSVMAPAVDPLPSSFVALGYDVPMKSGSSGFDCSPLSCNGMARQITVNPHCLLDDLDAALQTARRFSIEQPEPGSYFVVQVFRASGIGRLPA